MYIRFDSGLDLLQAARGLELPPGHHVMIWVADQSATQLPDALELLRAAGIPFFGAIFPGLITGSTRHMSGAILQSVPLVAGPFLARLEASGPIWVEPIVDLSELSSEKVSACVLVDCLAPGISELLTDLFHRFGDRASYFGAGCGTSRLDAVPVVFCNGQPRRDSVVLAMIQSRSRVGVRHGWTRTGDPVVATRTHGNVIEELNWEPALAVYRRELGEELWEQVTPETFFAVTGNHPFGIDREGTEDIVRDPIRMTESSHLVCLSSVPMHSVMHVLGSDHESLIAAATLAVRESARGGAGWAVRCMLVDCYSRWVLMGEAFERELQAIVGALAEEAPHLELEGVLALGEIASDGSRLPEFHNKSTAVGLFDA